MKSDKMERIFYTVLLFYFFPFLAFGQVKIEKESKVMSSEVPDKAISWLEEVFDQKSKLKWYFEINGEAESYEAKFIRESKKYSVKFNVDGLFVDIEASELWRKLPKKVKRNISNYFERQYLKSRIEKIQIQYTGSKENLKNLIRSDDVNQIVIKYELEFYGEDSNEKKLWEGLFDKDGNILIRREIILSPSNNLFF